MKKYTIIYLDTKRYGSHITQRIVKKHIRTINVFRLFELYDVLFLFDGWLKETNLNLDV